MILSTFYSAYITLYIYILRNTRRTSKYPDQFLLLRTDLALFFIELISEVEIVPHRIFKGFYVPGNIAQMGAEHEFPERLRRVLFAGIDQSLYIFCTVFPKHFGRDKTEF